MSSTGRLIKLKLLLAQRAFRGDHIECRYVPFQGISSTISPGFPQTIVHTFYSLLIYTFFYKKPLRRIFCATLIARFFENFVSVTLIWRFEWYMIPVACVHTPIVDVCKQATSPGHDLFPWQGHMISPWLKQKDNKLYISINPVGWIGFKNSDRLFTCFLTGKRFVIHSVVRNPLFIDYLHRVSPNFPVMLFLRQLSFREFRVFFNL